MAVSYTAARLEKAGEQGASGFLMTPAAQVAMFGFNALQTQLEIWRSVADSMRDNIRSQQDLMLRMMLLRSTRGDASESAEETAQATAETALNGASGFLTPMVAARRAYVQMSGAMIDAQREALQVFVSSARPH